MASSLDTRYCVFEEDGGSGNLGQRNTNDKDTRTKATHVEFLSCGIIATVSCLAYGTWDGKKAAMLVLQFRLRAPEGNFRFKRAELSLKFESQASDQAHPVIRRVRPKNNRTTISSLPSQASLRSTSPSTQLPSSGTQTPNSFVLWPAARYSISNTEWLGKSEDEPNQVGWRLAEHRQSKLGICDAIPLGVVVTFSGPFRAEVRANATSFLGAKLDNWPWSRDDPLLFDGVTTKGWQLAATDFLEMSDQDLDTFLIGEGRGGPLSFNNTLSPSKPIEAQAHMVGEQSTKVYRAQGIPSDMTCEDFIQAVSTILRLPKDSVEVKAFSSKEKTAIVSFSCVSPEMHSCAWDKSWQIQIPTTDTSDNKLHTFTSTIKFDRDFLGFTSLGHSNDSLKANVDIIAIHGLGGHAYGSFKQRGSNFMWLSDALAHDLSQMTIANRPIRPRILIYGYNARVDDSNSFQSIKDLSIQLRRLLREIRRDDPTRPIIFIGHSLGGLLIKELLIQQYQSKNDIDGSSFASCIECLFFGVPNRGMDISALLAIIGSRPNTDFLASLSIGSAFLQDQATLFPETFRSRDAVVYSFYETCVSNTAKMVDGKLAMTGDPVVLVDEDSATHSRPWEMKGTDHRIPIRRSHADLVKFEQYSTDYVMVRGCIRDVLNRYYSI
ncbi:ankyrin repeat-containing protein [Metarhizium guizhouense ARSEF 977]|uniref:Ankyrin repeat-containing protein n=1 Tax=Metarhizium guizhouense (strain ARSEF 977) TaxID=1276136 RepID=A0A0B4HBF3_METGA|nr:ankyrin repeat-containing protein [Metarhizium guizhouense ARSEF 977]